MLFWATKMKLISLDFVTWPTKEHILQFGFKWNSQFFLLMHTIQFFPEDQINNCTAKAALSKSLFSCDTEHLLALLSCTVCHIFVIKFNFSAHDTESEHAVLSKTGISKAFLKLLHLLQQVSV